MTAENLLMMDTLSTAASWKVVVSLVIDEYSMIAEIEFFVPFRNCSINSDRTSFGAKLPGW